MKYLRWFCFVVLGLPVLAWAFGALYFDGPSRTLAWALAAANLIVIIFVRPWLRKIGVLAVGFAVVLAWWLTLKPTAKATGSRMWRKNPGRRSTATR